MLNAIFAFLAEYFTALTKDSLPTQLANFLTPLGVLIGFVVGTNRLARRRYAKGIERSKELEDQVKAAEERVRTVAKERDERQRRIERLERDARAPQGFLAEMA